MRRSPRVPRRVWTTAGAPLKLRDLPTGRETYVQNRVLTRPPGRVSSTKSSGSVGLQAGRPQRDAWVQGRVDRAAGNAWCASAMLRPRRVSAV